MPYKAIVRVKGGEGSGNWGHAGRPGLVGGSGGGGGAPASVDGETVGYDEARQKYDIKYEASYVSEDRFNTIMKRVGTRDSLRPKHKIMSASALRRIGATGKVSANTVVVPKKGLFADRPLLLSKTPASGIVAGRGVVSWQVTPIGLDGNPLGGIMDSMRIPNDEL